MANSMIEERPGDPAIQGTRISVLDVFLDLLESDLTEEMIAKRLSLSAIQVAAARAYILNNPEAILARHHQIEARSKANLNPPEVVERARKTQALILGFKDWLKNHESAPNDEKLPVNGSGSPTLSFREWLMELETGPKNET